MTGPHIHAFSRHAFSRHALSRHARRPGLGLLVGGLAALASGALAAPAPPETPRAGPARNEVSRDNHNRRIRIHNQTGWTMLRLLAAESGNREPALGVLGPEQLPTGGNRAADVDDGSGACLFDLRADFTNGQSLTRHRVNVCRIADYYYTR